MPAEPTKAQNDEGDRTEEKKRFRQQDALHLLNRVQELSILDGDEVRADQKIIAILTQARDALNTLIGSGSAPSLESEVRDLGFGSGDTPKGKQEDDKKDDAK